jgi:RNA polymerase sigma factor (sigma-70 family)
MTDHVEEDEFLPTRRSLLTRLKDLGDQEGWREFFETYWRLIYGVARRAGLSDGEAQDLVQETMLVVSRQMPNFRYNPGLGSFKAWLHTVIRSRLGEHFRRRNRPVNQMIRPASDEGSEDGTNVLERAPDESGGDLEAVWDAEWEEHLLAAAMRRVRSKVSARQFLIFSMSAVKQLPMQTIARKLDVNLAQIYLARHRVGKMVKAELGQLRRQSEGPVR